MARGLMDDVSASECEANARLIAAAPDHAMLLSAICNGSARVEKWDAQRCEVCVGGMRYAVHFDQFGCPEMTVNLRAAIAKAEGK